MFSTKGLKLKVIICLALLALLAAPSAPAWAEPPALIEPDSYPVGSPERAMSRYLAAWQARNWPEMAKYCLASWAKSDRVTAKGVERYLRVTHGQNILAGARVMEIQVKSPTFAVALSKVWFDYKGLYFRHRLELLMAREDEKGRETKAGDWGVLPTSFSIRRIVE